MHHSDVLIIGAGPSGTVAAAWLAQKGHNVTVLERAHFPRFVIGESLLPLSMGHWEETGMLPALMQQGYAVKRGARFHKHGRVFDLAFNEGSTKGWDWTWQVPRSHFDHVLAKAAEAKGANIRFGQPVVSIDLKHEDGVKVTTQDDEGQHDHKASFLIDSSGYGGTLVKLLGLQDHRAGNGRMALFTHVAETDEERATHPDPLLISFEVLERELWFWSIPFSNNVTSIGFVGNKENFLLTEPQGPAGTMQRMLERSKIFRDRYHGKTPLFQPQVIEEYTHYNDSLVGDRYVLSGNCAGFLDPVFSSGVAFATESGLRAAKLLDRQLNGEHIDWKQEYEAHIRAGADVFRSYIEDWYSGDLQDVFFADTIEASHKQRIVSVLAGYAWDTSNPYVTRHQRAVKALAQTIRMSGQPQPLTIRSSK